MLLELQPDALEELEAAVVWHNRERAGRGDLLYDEVSRHISTGPKFRGQVSINLNEGVQLLVTKQMRIMLAPVEEKWRTRCAPNASPFGEVSKTVTCE